MSLNTQAGFYSVNREKTEDISWWSQPGSAHSAVWLRGGGGHAEIGRGSFFSWTVWNLEHLQSVKGCCQNSSWQSCKIYMKYHLTQLQQQLLLTSRVWSAEGAALQEPGEVERSHLHRMAEILQPLWSQSKKCDFLQRVSTVAASWTTGGWNCVAACVRCGALLSWRCVTWFSNRCEAKHQPWTPPGCWSLTEYYSFAGFHSSITSCQWWLWGDTCVLSLI